MKNYVLYAALFAASTGFAQENLSPLQAPTSPAAAVLGLQPSAVLNPKTYDALEAALYSNVLDNQGGPALPNDFALEFSPYWAQNHQLSLEDYLFPKKFSDQLKRNSSFSVASTKNFALGDSSASNGIAFGYRCTMFFGNQNDRDTITTFRSSLQQQLSIKSSIGSQVEAIDFTNLTKESFLAQTRPIVTAAIISAQKNSALNDVQELVNAIFSDAEVLLADVDIADEDAYKNKFYEIIDAHLQTELVFTQFKSYIRNRQGFSADVAYASFLNFPTNTFAYSSVPLQSFWVTPTYRLKNKLNFLRVMGVLRYQWYNADYYKVYFPQSTIYKNNLDYGVAFSAEAKRFSVKLEIVGRSSNSEEVVGLDDEGNELYRKIQRKDTQYVGTFNFNITDQIMLSYSLGSRFEPIAAPLNTLVSMLSLNFGFGAPKTNDVF